MADAARPRLLVDLDPAVYATAIAHLLQQADVDDVIVASTGDVHGPFDIAVVDHDDEHLDATVVVHLPGTAATGEEAAVEVVDRTGRHFIRPDDLLAYLDRVHPGRRPRAPRDS